jgi:ribosomal protein L29
MKAGELKTKKEVELQNLLKEKRAHLRDLRFKATSGRLSDNKSINQTKKDIARILTFLNQQKHA